MLSGFVIEHRALFINGEILLVSASIILYILLIFGRMVSPHLLRRFHRRLVVAGGVLLAVSLAIQVVVCSAEGNAVTTLVSFASFAMIVYINFMRRARAG